MLTRWLTFTALLAGSANPERGAVTVAPTCRVKGHRDAELTLNCGDGKNAGVVQYWHTPFGQLKTPGFYGKLDPVFMHHDGSLVVPNASILHSGLYYCLLKHTEGTTLWPYELHVSQHQKHSKYKQCSGSDAFRVKRDAGAERQAGVSDGQFAGAVAASVVLTFVLGFSAGALARSHILRCLRAVTSRLRSQRKQRCQTDTPRSEPTVTTLPPTYDNQAFEMERVLDDSSANCESMETTISSTTSSPPAKPKRSFRTKREDEVETTAYLEGCDYMRVEERRIEEEEAGRSVEERSEECDGETEDGKRGFYLLGEDGGSQIETEEDECSEERDEKDGGDKGKGAEEASEQENRSKEEGEEKRETEEEAGVSQERGRDEKGEKEGRDGEKKERKEDVETEDSSEKGEGSGITEDTMKDDIIGGGEGGVGGEEASSRPCRGRRSRVIRLYQYDDDGQRYSHLPDPAPDEPAPAPRLKQRSASLTRLSAIMAAASAGPLERKETGKEEREQRPHFHMEI